MQHSSRWRGGALLVLATVLGLSLAACSRAPVEEADGGASEATVQPVPGTDQSQVSLTERAANRLGIQTAPVRTVRVAAPKGPAGRRGGPTTRKVIPYAAVIYDENGDTWTFTNPAARTFLRQQIDVDYVSGDKAVLRRGPAVGTKVVTVGAAELLGAELGVGDE